MPFKRELSFFTVDAAGQDLSQLLRNIYGMSRNSSGKILVTDECLVSLTHFDEDAHHCAGIITRLRTQDIPVKANLHIDQFSDLILAENEGIAEMTFFYYIKSLRIICLLPAKNGVKCGLFSWYIQEKGNIPNFQLNPLLSGEAMRVFNSWRNISSIMVDFRLGNDSNPQSRTIQGLPVGALLRGAKAFQTSRVKVELCNSRSKGGLIPRIIREIGTSLLGVNEAHVEHIAIKGSRGAEYGDSIIDLISQRYRLLLVLGTSGGRRLDFEECHELVGAKIQEHETSLRELVGVN